MSDESSSKPSESPPHSPTADLAKDFNLGLNDNPMLSAPPSSTLLDNSTTDESSTDEAVFSDEEEEEKNAPPPPPPPLPETPPPAEIKEKVILILNLYLYESMFKLCE